MGHAGWGPTLWFALSGSWWASLYVVQLPMLAFGEREAMVMAARPTRDSAVLPFSHGCLAFLCTHVPPQSPPSHPLYPSLRSQQQASPWDCSTIPKFQPPAAVSSRAPASLSRVCMAVARTVLILIPFRLPQIRFSLSALNVSSLTQTVTPMWCSDPCFSSPTRWRQVQFYCLLTLLFSPLVHSFYQVSHSSIYYFLLVRYPCPLSAGVLHALLCRMCIPDVSMERDVLHAPLLLCHVVLETLSLFHLYFV